MALSKLKITWRDKNISLASKVKLMRTMILSAFLYASESWQATSKEGSRHSRRDAIGDLCTFPTKTMWRMKRFIARTMMKMNLYGNQDPLARRRQGTAKGARKRGRHKKGWEDNINDWTGMEFGDALTMVKDRLRTKGIVVTSSVCSTTFSVKGLRWDMRIEKWEMFRHCRNSVLDRTQISII